MCAKKGSEKRKAKEREREKEKEKKKKKKRKRKRKRGKEEEREKGKRKVLDVGSTEVNKVMAILACSVSEGNRKSTHTGMYADR